MCEFIRSILTPDFFCFFGSIVAAVIAWLCNERAKRQLQEYQRKEVRYRKLLLTLHGFHVSSKVGDADEKKSAKNAFLDQISLCWLYCPDDVIKKAYKFLNTVKTGQTSSDADKESALGELVAAIRRDLLSRKIVKRTSLQGRDFQILSST